MQTSTLAGLVVAALLTGGLVWLAQWVVLRILLARNKLNANDADRESLRAIEQERHEAERAEFLKTLLADNREHTTELLREMRETAKVQQQALVGTIETIFDRLIPPAAPAATQGGIDANLEVAPYLPPGVTMDELSVATNKLAGLYAAQGISMTPDKIRDAALAILVSDMIVGAPQE